MALTKNQIKFFQSLRFKKNRDNSNLFIAEGEKIIFDLFENIPCHSIIATKEWLHYHKPSAKQIFEVENIDEIKKISQLSTPTQVIALFEKIKTKSPTDINFTSQLVIALDGVQDPGNLGTIIRIADWFGINYIICSNNTVDVYNTKTIQSTMGAIARVEVCYTDLLTLIKNNKNIPIYGTFLNGNNIYNSKLSKHGIIIMGNEGNGISSEIEKLVTQKLYIPPYPNNIKRSESLNVAVATGIICSEFRKIK